MTAQQTPSNEGSNDNHRTRWRVIPVAAWLLLVSLLAVVNRVDLSRLAKQSQANTQDGPMQALGARLGALEQQVDVAKHLPKPIAQSDLDASRRELDERIAHLEQAQATDTHTDPQELQALQGRVSALEGRLKTPPPSAVAPRKVVVAAKPTAAAAPPFNVVGVELRGDTRLLSIASPKATSMEDVRLLREGDAVGAWHLQAIEAHAAVFRVDGQGQAVRIALP